MTEETNMSMNDIAAKSLGSSTSYAVYTDQFDPTLLNPMPRNLAREHWGITGKEFVGYDVWHCHEATFLMNSGCPVAGTLKFVYPSTSEFMVESKSAKLYLNSFDMCKMGDTVESAIAKYEAQVASDLSKVVGAKVEVKFFSASEFGKIRPVNILAGYQDISQIEPTVFTLPFTDYYGNEKHVKLKNSSGDVKFFTNALRSRCRHTKQKDTGLAAIYHKSYGGATVDELSVFKQIVSLREVNEFHEFCAEKVFTEIAAVVSPGDDICVTLLYSRRGSLDINPVRASSWNVIPDGLVNVNTLTMKVQGQ